MALAKLSGEEFSQTKAEIIDVKKSNFRNLPEHEYYEIKYLTHSGDGQTRTQIAELRKTDEFKWHKSGDIIDVNYYPSYPKKPFRDHNTSWRNTFVFFIGLFLLLLSARLYFARPKHYDHERYEDDA